MILTAAFMICKALGATWSWWFMILTVLAVYEAMDNFNIIIKDKSK